LRPSWQNTLYRAVEKKYLRSVDGFIFNSQTTRSVVDGLLADMKPSVIAYPPTDRFGEQISESEIIERAQIPTLQILFLGNVIYRKGLHTLLKAINLLHLDIRLDIAGSSTSQSAYAQAILKQVAVQGLSSIVHFHGPLDNQPLIDLLKQSHVIVVPSSYEGFGIVYLEGMGFGLPAIGTTAGAAGEIITHGENGYLIQPDDAETLAKHLSDLAKDRTLLTQLSFNALKRFRQQPKWEQTTGKIRSFLLSMI
jgi:glycosyltransferase involved in cell wall biosynthesis